MKTLAIMIGLVLAIAGMGCDLDMYTGHGGGYYDPAPVYYVPSIYCETVCDGWDCWEECY